MKLSIPETVIFHSCIKIFLRKLFLIILLIIGLVLLYLITISGVLAQTNPDTWSIPELIFSTSNQVNFLKLINSADGCLHAF